MNNTKIVLTTALCLFFGFSSLMAQGRQGKGADIETRVEKQTQRMVDSLGLNATQAEQVKALNLQHAQKLQEMRGTAREDRQAMRAELQTLNEQRQAQLQEILTEEQYAKLEEMRKDRREQLMDRRRQRGKGRKKGQNNAPQPSDPGEDDQ